MHALLLAVGLWAVAAGLLTLGTTYRDPFDQLKWSDFVNIYTMGDIARTGPASVLYDPEAEYRRQVALVPESAAERVGMARRLFEGSSQNSPALRRQSRVAIYALFIFLLVPTARFVPLQLSPLLMLWLLHAASRRRCA